MKICNHIVLKCKICEYNLVSSLLTMKKSRTMSIIFLRKNINIYHYLRAMQNRKVELSKDICNSLKNIL